MKFYLIIVNNFVGLSPDPIIVGTSVTASYTPSFLGEYYLEVYNEWTLTGKECIEVEGATQVFTSTPIVFKMESVDGITFESKFVVPNPGNFSIVIRFYNQNMMMIERWNNFDFSGDRMDYINETTTLVSDIYHYFPNEWTGECAYKSTFSFKPVTDGLYNFTFNSRSDGLIYLDGEYVGYSYQFSNANFQAQMSTENGRLYAFEMQTFDRSVPSASVTLRYSVNSAPLIGIQSYEMFHEKDNYTPSHLTSTSSCHSGYSTVESGSVVTWEVVWGDGLKKDEAWDDENSDSGDGCSSSCQIEEGFAWDGGDLQTKDTWKDCRLTGQSPNDDKSDWETKWGDGMVADDEDCDDGNEDSGDGCSDSWSFEFRYKCSGGSHSTSSTWQEWPDGETTDSNHLTCTVLCGDSVRHSSEEWDDGNQSDSDGCSQSCLIEDDYICTGGDGENKDTCTKWGSGTSPNDDKTEWIAVWGDSRRHEDEEWDDGNEDNNDGCNSSWEIGKEHKTNVLSFFFS